MIDSEGLGGFGDSLTDNGDCRVAFAAEKYRLEKAEINSIHD